MTKFHINDAGEPAPCKAQAGNCPLGANTSHGEFASKAEAQAWAEDILAKKFAEDNPSLRSKPTRSPRDIVDSVLGGSFGEGDLDQSVSEIAASLSIYKDNPEKKWLNVWGEVRSLDGGYDKADLVTGNIFTALGLISEIPADVQTRYEFQE